MWLKMGNHLKMTQGMRTCPLVMIRGVAVRGRGKLSVQLLPHKFLSIKKISTPVEKVECGVPQVNMSNIDINMTKHDAIVTPNHMTEGENDSVRHDFIYCNAPFNMDSQSAAWMYGSILGANNLSRWEQVPHHSVPIFPQIPPGGNFPSYSQTLVYHGSHSIPHYTPVRKHRIPIINCVYVDPLINVI